MLSQVAFYFAVMAAVAGALSPLLVHCQEGGLIGMLGSQVSLIDIPPAKLPLAHLAGKWFCLCVCLGQYQPGPATGDALT